MAQCVRKLCDNRDRSECSKEYLGRRTFLFMGMKSGNRSPGGKRHLKLGDQREHVFGGAKGVHGVESRKHSGGISARL